MRAIDRDIGSCHVCHQLVKIKRGKKEYCPRCGTVVHIRKPDSLNVSLALVIASIILYIPANLYPMMHVHTFAGTQSDTIISGIIYFFESGSYLIAFVILIASVVVPFIKMVILLYLIYSVKRGRAEGKEQKLRLYILTEIIGKWSMVDVYVVAIMIALVHFGALTEIKAGAGAVFFLTVVILTMLSAMSFDSRLIWDMKGKEEDE